MYNSKNGNFGQKSKFWPNIKILVKNRNFDEKMEILVKNGNFGQKSKLNRHFIFCLETIF